MAFGVQRVPLGGFGFISPVFRIHLLVSNYIQSCVQLSLRRLRHVYNLKYSMYYMYMYYIYS